MSSFGIIRDISADELELMLSWRNAPAARRNMYTRHTISLAEHLAWWDKIKMDTGHRYFMYEEEGTPLGIVGFNNIDQVNKNSSWSFYASPDAPRGTGSKMEYLALNYAFGELGLHKLVGEVLAFNEPVIKLHKKFGFKIEGILRDQHLVDEKFIDVVRIGILTEEWEAQRELMHSKITARSRSKAQV